jgi:tetratricopeptide (TPR) repeat protein
MLGLSDDEARRGDINRFLYRGAMLHSDIGILAWDGALAAASGATAREGLSVRIADGRQEGYDDTTRHWEMARALLDAVAPDPARDEWVRLWYRAAAAHMRSHSLLGPAQPMLDRARQLFPTDAEILFHSGCLHEASASPAVQSALASIKVPQAALPISRLPGTHWEAAVSFFRDALRIQPAWPEARVRLGRVLGLLGRHKEAAAELGRALDETTHPTLIYCASLFLGDEEQALDHRDRARACYERALAYRPRAQAPHLALSQLARREGDLTRARAEVRTVLALPPDESGRYDPLWDYFVGPQSQEADTLFTELRRLLDQRRSPEKGAPR